MSAMKHYLDNNPDPKTSTAAYEFMRQAANAMKLPPLRIAKPAPKP